MDESLQTTPLTDWHRNHGARLVPFAGFAMPVQYSSVLLEHAAVREKVGLFDITHMGEIRVDGPMAGQWLDGLSTNFVKKLGAGDVVYTAMCREDGGILDDMLIYRLAEERWYVVCNASNHAKIFSWLKSNLPEEGVALEDVSDETALIAVQGPDALELVKRIGLLANHLEAVEALDFYTALECAGPAGSWIVSRTGYTGERGYELYVPNADAVALWEELIGKGEDLGVLPIGLAARDTLRFEVCYSLYGHELGEDTTPLEAGIGWAVKLKKKSGFTGQAALVQQKTDGVPRRLVGLEIEGRTIARQDARILYGERLVGKVTSGTFSPTLEKPLALAIIEVDAPDEGLEVEVRGKRFPCRNVRRPFLDARVKGDPHSERQLV